jgi:hypothetical protein
LRTNQPVEGVASAESHDERSDDEVGGLAFSHQPPDDPLS